VDTVLWYLYWKYSGLTDFSDFDNQYSGLTDFSDLIYFTIKWIIGNRTTNIALFYKRLNISIIIIRKIGMRPIRQYHKKISLYRQSVVLSSFYSGFSGWFSMICLPHILK